MGVPTLLSAGHATLNFADNESSILLILSWAQPQLTVWFDHRSYCFFEFTLKPLNILIDAPRNDDKWSIFNCHWFFIKKSFKDASEMFTWIFFYPFLYPNPTGSKIIIIWWYRLGFWFLKGLCMANCRRPISLDWVFFFDKQAYIIAVVAESRAIYRRVSPGLMNGWRNCPIYNICYLGNT